MPAPRRRIRSYVLRKGRMTPGQQAGLSQHWSSYGLETEMGVPDLDLIFGRAAPRTLEIGFGMGDSLLSMARDTPEQDFIGIEVHAPGVGRILAEAARHALTNLRVYQADAVEVVSHCLPDHSLQCVQIFFPDPWHKKRHHKRRLIQADFVQQLHGKLQPGGVLHIATDWQPYAEHCLETLQALPNWQNLSADGGYVPRPDTRPITKFELRGKNLGHGVWDIMFRA